MFKSMQLRSHTVRALTATSCAAIGLALFSSGAQAQNSRWEPWVGCWAPSTAQTGGSLTSGGSGMLCVVPSADGNDVDLATVANGKVVHVEHVSATGTQIPKTIDKCPGWESATWSTDNHRVFLRSEFNCAASAKVKGSGILAINGDGEFLQIQGTSVAGNANARAIRYQSAGIGVVLKPGQTLTDSAIVTTAPLKSGFASQSMRVAAGAPISSEAIIDATKHVDESVASAWITEIGQQFAVSGKELVKLADAGVPAYTIDLMVALSYPDRYSLRRNGAQVSGGGSATSGGVTVTNEGTRVADSRYDSRYQDGYWDCGYGSRMFSYGYYSGGCNSMSSYDRYAYGSSYGYGYNPYYYGQQPVVIIVKGNEGNGTGTTPVQGRAVNGQGYTHTGGSSATTSSSPKTSSGSSGSSSTSSSSGGSSSSGASAAAASGGEARTAKPRNPPPPPPPID